VGAGIGVGVGRGRGPGPVRGAILHGQDCTHRDQRGLVELAAESVAYVICARLGIASDDHSFGYIAGWTGENAATLIRASGERIRDAVAQILAVDSKEALAAA